VAINWCSLVPSEAAFVGQSLTELSERLAANYPQFPRVELQELSVTDRARVGLYLAQEIAGTRGYEADPFDDLTLFVLCSRSEEAARAIRSENPMAEWGGARRGVFAVVWEPDNRYLLWHEAMHLLHAADCYDLSTGQSTCDQPHCLMQWEPSESNCGGSLVLCAANVNRVAQNF
jgi:hypothetical protein